MTQKLPVLRANYYEVARLTPEAEAAYAKYALARDAAKVACGEFEKAVMETPQIKALMLFIDSPSRINMFDSKEEVFRVGARTGSYSGGLKFEYSPPSQAYLDPKTINLLLSGKLLTDEQKKKLLKQQGLDLFDGNADTSDA